MLLDLVERFWHQLMALPVLCGEKIPRGLSALLEVGVMFLPAIPAYLWMWPSLEGQANDIAQSIAYVYVLAGTLFISLRRWSWYQLGINRNGLWLSLTCGLLILIGRLMSDPLIDPTIERIRDFIEQRVGPDGKFANAT